MYSKSLSMAKATGDFKCYLYCVGLYQVYSKCNTHTYIALKFILLQVTVHFTMHRWQISDKFCLWVLHCVKDAVEETRDMDPSSFRSAFIISFKSLKYLRVLCWCIHATFRDLEAISSCEATQAWNLNKTRLLTHLCQQNHLFGCFSVKLCAWFPIVCIINVYAKEIFKQQCRNCLWQRS